MQLNKLLTGTSQVQADGFYVLLTFVGRQDAWELSLHLTPEPGGQPRYVGVLIWFEDLKWWNFLKRRASNKRRARLSETMVYALKRKSFFLNAVLDLDTEQVDEAVQMILEGRYI